jgi:aspartokinase
MRARRGGGRLGDEWCEQIRSSSSRATFRQAPTEREMDVLLATASRTTIALTAMAINGLGKKAVSLTGAQAGIITDGVHTKAKIANITPRQVHNISRTITRSSSRVFRARPQTDASPRSDAAART